MNHDDMVLEFKIFLWNVIPSFNNVAIIDVRAVAMAISPSFLMPA